MQATFRVTPTLQLPEIWSLDVNQHALQCCRLENRCGAQAPAGSRRSLPVGAIVGIVVGILGGALVSGACVAAGHFFLRWVRSRTPALHV